jgi:TolA-binding protein
VITANHAAADIVEGVPWWWTAIGLPVLGVVIAALMKWLKLSPGTPATPSKEAPGIEGPATRPTPVTSDEKLDATRELIVELRSQRDRLAAQIEDMNTRHEQELDEMKVRHQQEMAQVQYQVRAQEEYITRIERLLGMPPQPPPPLPQGPPFDRR